MSYQAGQGTNPVPTSAPDPIPVGGYTNTTNTPSWNQQWNTIWNQAWNAGYNNGGRPSVDSSFQSAVDQGYSAGQNAYKSRQAPAGSVLGAKTVETTSPTLSQPAYDPYAAYRTEISTAWDNYLNSLSGQTDYLNQQQAAQQNIANTQFDQGQTALNTQKASSLKDIANTTKNAFQAANNYLGSLGAADSSASNQYSFAINQQAQKQTGDLNNYVNAQLQTLGYQRDQQLNQIGLWFAQQQQALKQQLAEGQLRKGQDLQSLSMNILNQALNWSNQVKTNAQNQYNSLVQWAANNSSNIGQLQGNIQQIGNMFSPGQISTIGGNSNQIRYGGSPVNVQKTDLWGNPIL